LEAAEAVFAVDASGVAWGFFERVMPEATGISSLPAIARTLRVLGTT